jgi:hypothetical protein
MDDCEGQRTQLEALMKKLELEQALLKFHHTPSSVRYAASRAATLPLGHQQGTAAYPLPTSLCLCRGALDPGVHI